MYHIRFRLYTSAFVMIICLILLILILVCSEGKTELSGNDYIEFMKKKIFTKFLSYLTLEKSGALQTGSRFRLDFSKDLAHELELCESLGS